MQFAVFELERRVRSSRVRDCSALVGSLLLGKLLLHLLELHAEIGHLGGVDVDVIHVDTCGQKLAPALTAQSTACSANHATTRQHKASNSVR